VPNIIKTTHCLAAMSIKDHLIKLTMWWQGAQKLNNVVTGGDRGPKRGRPPPLPPRQFRNWVQGNARWQ